jgi:hypothetical protein
MNKFYHHLGIFDVEDYFTFLAVVEINHKKYKNIVESGYQQFLADVPLPVFSIKLMFLLARMRRHLTKLKENNLEGETYNLNYPSQVIFVVCS